MNDRIVMNQSQSIGISARGRALGCGHALGPWALGPGLGPGRRRPGTQRVFVTPTASLENAKFEATVPKTR